MSNKRHLQSTNTPTKRRNVEYELPDTPTSLASSYNKDVIYVPSSPNCKTSTTCTRHEANESRDSLQDDSLLNFTKEMRPNALHDSIDSSISNPHHPNSSILGDFNDIKAMIAQKERDHRLSSPQQNESELIQKWLQDRNRWDTIQQSYEQKVADAQTKLNQKSMYFNQRIEAMMKQELQYQDQITSLKQQIETLNAGQSQKYNTLHHQHQTLIESNGDLKGKYDDLQSLTQELRETLTQKDSQIEALESAQRGLKSENMQLHETNRNLVHKMDALSIGMESDLKLKTKELNEELMSSTKELRECQQENERLKHLEMSSQSMVERLLKRLEQQIHSAEDVQHQLDLKEKEHQKEILRLETINEKLQRHLTVFNGTKTTKKIKSMQTPKLKVNTKQSSPSSPCSTNSESSLFTLSTVMTTDLRTNIVSLNNNTKRSNKGQIPNNVHSAKSDQSLNALQSDLDAVKSENERLKETIKTFREMVHLDDESNIDRDRNVQRDEEWITRIKEMAKQTVLIERLKNEMTRKDGELMENKRTLIQYETIIGDQKETIQSLEDNLNQQRQSLMMLEKTNSDISMQLIEERTLRQKLNKEIQDLEFENKQIRRKLSALKNLATESTVDEHHRDHQHSLNHSKGEKVGNLLHHDMVSTNPPSDVRDGMESELVGGGRLSDANSATLTARSEPSNVMDKELLDGLRGLLRRFSMQDQSEPIRPPLSAPNVLSHSRKQRKQPLESTTSSATTAIHRTATSTDSMSIRREKRKRQRVSSLTPSYLSHHKQSQSRNMRRKRSSSLHHPAVTPSVHAKCVRVEVTRNPRKVVRSKLDKASKSGKVKSKAKGRKRMSRRNKSSQSASRQRALKPCIHNKKWA